MRACLLIGLILPAFGLAAEGSWVSLPGNVEFKTVLAYEDTASSVSVIPFEMMV